MEKSYLRFQKKRNFFSIGCCLFSHSANIADNFHHYNIHFSQRSVIMPAMYMKWKMALTIWSSVRVAIVISGKTGFFCLNIEKLILLGYLFACISNIGNPTFH